MSEENRQSRRLFCGLPSFMHIEKLNQSHALAYKALMLDAYRESADAYTSSYQERASQSDDWWAHRVAGSKPESVTFGGFQAGELVATARLELYDGHKTRHKAHLTAVYVRPAARRLGYGRGLLESVLKEAKERPGIRLVNLSVTEGNQAALALYEKAGFIMYGVEPMAILGTQAYLSKVLMVMTLDPISK